jgi:hypothetical protein
MSKRACNAVAPEQMDRISNEGRSRSGAADYLRQKFGEGSASALAKVASSPAGPAHYKFGKKVIYLDDDLDAWALRRLRRVEPIPE